MWPWIFYQIFGPASAVCHCNESHSSVSWGLRERLSSNIYFMAQPYNVYNKVQSLVVFCNKINLWQFFNGQFDEVLEIAVTAN